MPNWMKTRYGRVQRQRKIAKLYPAKQITEVKNDRITDVEYDDIWKDFEEEIKQKREDLIACGWVPGVGTVYKPADAAPECKHLNTVENCQHVEFAFEVTCADCGLVLGAVNNEMSDASVVQFNPSVGEDGGARGPGSVYQRIGYWKERLNQLTCEDSMPADKYMEKIKTQYYLELQASKRKIVPTKSRILKILLKLKKIAIQNKCDVDRKEYQRCSEKWIMIRCAITGETPPKMDYELHRHMQKVFYGVEIGFMNIDHPGRTSIISTNHIMARELHAYAIEHANQNAASMIKYLPQLKSKSKLKNVSDIYDRIMVWLRRPIYPPPEPKTFKGYK